MEAFETMANLNRTLQISVVDERGKFLGMIFREDFRDILIGWKMHQVLIYAM